MEIQFKVISFRFVFILILELVCRMVRLIKLNDGLHSNMQQFCSSSIDSSIEQAATEAGCCIFFKVVLTWS